MQYSNRKFGNWRLSVSKASDKTEQTTPFYGPCHFCGSSEPHHCPPARRVDARQSAAPAEASATPDCCAECATEGCDGTTKYCCCHAEQPTPAPASPSEKIWCEKCNCVHGADGACPPNPAYPPASPSALDLLERYWRSHQDREWDFTCPCGVCTATAELLRKEDYEL